MLHLQQPALLRVTARGFAGVLAVVGGLLACDGAAAQTVPCYEVIPARANIEPPVPMMVDKCSGRTWLLARNGRAAYRWAPIAADPDKPKAADRPAIDAGSSAGDAAQKCFTFNNRKFCE